MSLGETSYRHGTDAGRTLKARIGALLPAGTRRRLADLIWSRGFETLPDRAYMRDVIFPALAVAPGNRVLFVGCRVYTRRYIALAERIGLDLWTTDIDPAAAADGAPGRHVAGDITRLPPDAFPHRFDAIVYSGVVGFGVDDMRLIDAGFSNLARLVRPGGLLVIGWNAGLTVDPLRSASFADRFARIAAPDGRMRVSFEGTTHTYDFAIRKAAAVSAPEARREPAEAAT